MEDIEVFTFRHAFVSPNLLETLTVSIYPS